MLQILSYFQKVKGKLSLLQLGGPIQGMLMGPASISYCRPASLPITIRPPSFIWVSPSVNTVKIKICFEFQQPLRESMLCTIWVQSDDFERLLKARSGRDRLFFSLFYLALNNSAMMVCVLQLCERERGIFFLLG